MLGDTGRMWVVVGFISAAVLCLESKMSDEKKLAIICAAAVAVIAIAIYFFLWR